MAHQSTAQSARKATEATRQRHRAAAVRQGPVALAAQGDYGSELALLQLAREDPMAAPPGVFLQLQRLYGNRAVGRLIQRSIPKSQFPSPNSQFPNLQASGELEGRLASQRGRGQPLPGEVRSFMEPRFGADFGDVRVHTDAEAAQLSRDLHAQAFTHGRDVYFGAGRYAPETDAGKRLLAHELTHVVQQTGVRRSPASGNGDLRRRSQSPQPTAAGQVGAAHSQVTVSARTGQPVIQRLSWWQRAKKWAFEKALGAVGVDKEAVMGLINRAGSAVMEIVYHPGRFVNTLIRAVTQGFRQFLAHIGKYLKAGLMGWLFGAMAKSGLQTPQDFSARSILTVVLQALGISPEQLKEKIRAKLVQWIGEKNVARLEQAGGFLRKLIGAGGVAGFVSMLASYASGLKTMVIDTLKTWVITHVVQGAVLKVLSLFNPVSGFFAIIKMIYNVIKFLVEQAGKLRALFAAVVGAVVPLAKGKAKQAADRIEQALGQSIALALGFLAGFLGLGNIAEAVKGVLKRVKGWVDKAINRILKKARKLIKGIGRKLGIGKKGLDKTRSPREKRDDLRQAIVEAEQVMSESNATPDTVKRALPRIRAKYGLVSLILVRQRGNVYYVEGMVNPKERSNAKTLQDNRTDSEKRRAISGALLTAEAVLREASRLPIGLEDKLKIVREKFDKLIARYKLTSLDYRLSQGYYVAVASIKPLKPVRAAQSVRFPETAAKDQLDTLKRIAQIDPVAKIKLVQIVEDKAIPQSVRDAYMSEFYKRINKIIYNKKLKASELKKFVWKTMQNIATQNASRFLGQGPVISTKFLQKAVTRFVPLGTFWRDNLTQETRAQYQIKYNEYKQKPGQKAEIYKSGYDMWADEVNRNGKIEKEQIDKTSTVPAQYAVGWWVLTPKKVKQNIVEIVENLALQRERYADGCVKVTVPRDVVAGSLRKPTALDGIFFEEWKPAPGLVYGLTAKGGIPEAVTGKIPLKRTKIEFIKRPDLSVRKQWKSA